MTQGSARRKALVSTELRVLSAEQVGKYQDYLTADLRRLAQIGNSKEQSKALRVISRRPTPTNADEDLFTAETPFDGLRVVSRVQPQRSQRIAFFVCRETTTNKNMSPLGPAGFAQSSSPDWAKILPFAYSASLRIGS